MHISWNNIYEAGRYPYKISILFTKKALLNKKILKPVFYNSREQNPIFNYTPSSPERSREVEEQTSFLHVRVHQIPKDLVTTVPLANCSDRFHQSAVHIPVTWRPKHTNARNEKTASVGCNMVSTPWCSKRLF